jgi:glycosyltransferase involved in cell wall biosynthesis
MLIAFVPLPYQRHSGAGNYYHKLFLNLNKLDRQNQYRMYLPADAPADTEDILGREQCRRMAISSNPAMLRIARSLVASRRIFGKEAPDLVHYFNVPVFAADVPFVVTVFDVRDYDVPGLTARRRTLAGSFFRHTSFHRAKAIVTISDFSAQRLGRHFPECAAKVKRVYLGVDAEFRPANAPADRPHARPYLLAVGHIEPRKNLRRLVRAFLSLTSDIEHDLVIVGKSVHDGELRAITELAAALPGRIHLTGAVDQPVLVRWYQHADLLAFPSLYEGFGLPVVEAMACNVPVITSNSSAFPELMREAEFMFPAENEAAMAAAVRRALTDSEFRKRLVDHGRRTAQEFTWKKTAEETIQVYQKAVVRSGISTSPPAPLPRGEG